jgi:hypothetical protein
MWSVIIIAVIVGSIVNECCAPMPMENSQHCSHCWTTMTQDAANIVPFNSPGRHILGESPTIEGLTVRIPALPFRPADSAAISILASSLKNTALRI